jgi:pyruvate dehydrogenase E1 component
MERHNRLHPHELRQVSYVTQCLSGTAPVVAATDYVAAYAGLVASYVDAPFIALGTDGFGRSDTRAALRRFFEVDRNHVTLTALYSLVKSGQLSADVPEAAIKRYGIDRTAASPWTQ